MKNIQNDESKMENFLRKHLKSIEKSETEAIKQQSEAGKLLEKIQEKNNG